MGLLDMLLGAQGAQTQGTAQVPGQEAGFFKRLLAPEVALPMAAGLMGNQGNMQNLGQAFAYAAPAMAQQRKDAKELAQQNKTLEFFKANNPEYAQAIASGMPVSDAWKAYVDSKKPQSASDDYVSVGGGNLFRKSTGEWLSAPGGGAEGVAGLAPVWGRDANGNWTIGQLTKDGKVLQSELPEGFTPAGPYEKAFQTGAGGEAGKVAGGAQTALPGARQVAARVSTQVDDLKNDPYLHRMLGPMDSRLPSFTADAARVQSKIDQLNSGAFLEARQALKGGGAITDFESQKAEAALARLNTAQSEDDFKAALDEFNTYIQQGLQKIESQAGMTGNPNAPAQGGAGGGADPLGIRN